MRRITANLLLMLFFKSFSAMAQDSTRLAPDYKALESTLGDTASVYFYPRLMNRLTAGDTTLSPVEYHLLYFGYALQPAYSPYQHLDLEDQMQKYYRMEKLKPRDYPKIIELGNRILKEMPFELRVLNYLGYVYHLSGNEVMARTTVRRYFMTLGAILESGDGKSCETAFHVTSVRHEYAVLNHFRFQYAGQALATPCDVISVQKDARGVESLYFNISAFFRKEQ